MLGVSFLLMPACSSAAKESFGSRPDVQKFIDEMVQKHQFNKENLSQLFGQIYSRPDIIKAMSSPAEAKPWYQYRPIFLKERRIKGGVAFWNQYQKILQRAEETYGVPAQIIVAIIGVETRYGTYKGKHKVLESISTLAFDYPKRAKFFRSELEQYLLLTREESIDPLSLKGSYAGAMGSPQFISSSYRRYAVDFDGDGKRDLWENMTDVIGSVANYFSVHGWVTGDPVTTRASVSGDRYKPLLELGIRPKKELDHFSNLGVTISGQAPGDRKMALIELETKGEPEYWAGFKNFYVITRYNHSALYAMAVWQLSEEIRSRREHSR
jgi:membrane-bound lytic murein transglycosylase B